MPITSTGSGEENDGTVVLTNWKSGSYDGFVVKINSVTGTGLWAVAPGQTPEGRNYARKVATSTSGHVFVTMDKRPSSTYIGRLYILDGATGAVTFSAEYDNAMYFYCLEAIGDFGFFGGRLKGGSAAGADIFGTGVITTGTDGEDYAGFVNKVGTDGVSAWTVTVGGRTRAIGKSPDGLHIYAAGENEAAWTSGSCSLTGANGGFLVKLLASTGACVWAKDIADNVYALAADATYVYGGGYEDGLVTMGGGLEINSRGPEHDFMLVKWAAADGAGQWGASMGGTGDDYLYSLAVSSSGLALGGRTSSQSIDFAGVTLTNLQHSRAEAASGSDTVNAGLRSGVVAMLDLGGQVPSCLSGCSTTTATATIASGKCFSGGKCYDTGAADMFKGCFACDAAVSQTGMQGPDTANHCYISGSCFPTGARAPAYQRYNQASVCEVCDPTVNPTGYSLVSGYIHDRDLARSEPGRQGRRLSATNNYGMIFEGSSNGCQLLPALEMPAGTAGMAAAAASAAVVAATIEGATAALIGAIGTVPSGLAAAAGRAVAGTGEYAGVDAAARKAAVDVMATDAIPMAIWKAQIAGSTLSTWQGPPLPTEPGTSPHAIALSATAACRCGLLRAALCSLKVFDSVCGAVAWAYYNGDESTCTTVASTAATAAGNLLCAATPAATAEAHATLFGTNLHYGNAVAIVKTKQAMALGAANAEATTPDASLAASFLADAEMHSMVPYYQGLLAMTNEMDTATTAAARKIAQLKANVYMGILEPMLLASAGMSDRHSKRRPWRVPALSLRCRLLSKGPRFDLWWSSRRGL